MRGVLKVEYQIAFFYSLRRVAFGWGILMWALVEHRPEATFITRRRKLANEVLMLRIALEN